jgi:UPF0755 protein
MGRARHSKTSHTSPSRMTTTQVVGRLLILAITVGVLAVAAVLVLRSLSRSGNPTTIGFGLPVNPSLGPVEAARLSLRLSANQDALTQPAGEDNTPVNFEISSGQSAGEIANNLFEAGLISDAALFQTYLYYYGLDTQLEAGVHQLNQTMTIPEIAVALMDAEPQEITVSIPEGWRREQIADWIDQQGNLPFTGAEFLIYTGTNVTLPPEISFSGEIPSDSTLEGFLFPDTYRLPVDATAADFILKMLKQLDAQFTPEMRADAAASGLGMRDVLIMASIVEREGIVADELPTIASVYLNRLDVNMKLEADPTVQYAMGYQADSGEWWNLNLTQADYFAVESPYNTYLYPGLPPGPIANPGINAIQAVIYPAETPYYYFRAACDRSGRHNFAVTFEEHVANGCQ